MKIELKPTTTGWWAIFIDGTLFYAAAKTKQAAIEFLKKMKIKYEEDEA